MKGQSRSESDGDSGKGVCYLLGQNVTRLSKAKGSVVSEVSIKPWSLSYLLLFFCFFFFPPPAFDLLLIWLKRLEVDEDQVVRVWFWFRTGAKLADLEQSKECLFFFSPSLSSPRWRSLQGWWLRESLLHVMFSTPPYLHKIKRTIARVWTFIKNTPQFKPLDFKHDFPNTLYTT